MVNILWCIRIPSRKYKIKLREVLVIEGYFCQLFSYVQFTAGFKLDERFYSFEDSKIDFETVLCTNDKYC